MKYILQQGGYSINKKAPVIIDIIDCENIIEAKKVAKSKGKEFTVEPVIKSNIDFDIKHGGIPKDFYSVWGSKL